MSSATIGSLRINLGIDTGAFTKGLKQASTGFQGIGASLRRLAVPLAAFGTSAALGVGVAVRSTISAADELNEAAKQIGVPIEQLSRLKYAGEQAGIGLDGLKTALGALSKSMVAAKDGVGPAAETFKKLGVSITDAKGNLRPTSDVLDDLADAFQKMGEGPDRTAAAMQLMGKAGKDMVPLLADGAKELGKMKAEADKFGQVFNAEMGANADQFGDNIGRLERDEFTSGCIRPR
jgi:hypothetical protein